MKQHPVDLMPESIRLRANARIATSRNITYAALTAVLLIVSATHARLLETRAESRYDVLETQAKQVELNQEQIRKLESELNDLRYLRNRYESVELPIPISSVIATIVESMPASVTIERIECNADQLRRSSPFERKGEDANRRYLVGEIAGFAVDDLDIADFVSNLDRRKPFQEVSLDFSRQRIVNEVPAREFRMSFVIDFEKLYHILEADVSESNAISAAGEGL